MNITSRVAGLLFLVGTALVVPAQQTTPPTPSVAAEDPADEIGKLKKNCPFHHFMGCAEVLFTGTPIHIAAGSIAPQNGVGVGLAYVGHKTTDNWRISWNSDAVASPNASWRAGLYVKFVDTRQPEFEIQKGTANATSPDTELPEQPTINVYVQATSLNKLTYFGLGPETLENARSFYGMTETIVGANGITRTYSGAHLSLYGELNGRWVAIRPRHGESSPSIGQLYTETTAPGLATQPFSLQPGAGFRFHPSSRDNRFHLNYDVGYRPYFAVSDSHYSFQRLSAILGHEISLYRTVIRLETPRPNTGPDECYLDVTVDNPSCPKVTTRNLEGSIGLTLFSNISFNGQHKAVPFFFQPTLGGSDIQGNASLSSYQDYRFRAPNLLLLRESFEHSLGKYPVGLVLWADQGTLGIARTDLTEHWRHSFAAGISIKAGGLPQLYVFFAWGGQEGTHTTVHLNNTLLGGSTRPSLF
jgi:hypothetical protein